MKKILAGVLIVVMGLFFLAPTKILATPCNGDFNCDGDVDSDDVTEFINHFGRNQHNNPCDPCFAPSPVPKTGQKTSYAIGDDGDLEKGVSWPILRFTDNEDGTVTDNLTGLIWLKNANCFETARTWYEALSDCNGLSTGFCGLTDGSNVGDWRLPNYSELISLLDFESDNPALPTAHPFNNLKLTSYWSSTTTPGDSGFAASMQTVHGSRWYSDKYDFARVWPVRGGQ